MSDFLSFLVTNFAKKMRKKEIKLRYFKKKIAIMVCNLQNFSSKLHASQFTRKRSH